MPYAYYSDNSGWMLCASGPDGIYNCDPRTIYSDSLTATNLRLVEFTYDPTNGSFSPGDIFSFKVTSGGR
ncbi:hypothetical protein HY256_01205 [Candidatus Sumerlaeota bacterium]|nr:hypothetical protein [Candidatus Sumerlaeota bacterium]